MTTLVAIPRTIELLIGRFPVPDLREIEGGLCHDRNERGGKNAANVRLRAMLSSAHAEASRQRDRRQVEAAVNPVKKPLTINDRIETRSSAKAG